MPINDHDADHIRDANIKLKQAKALREQATMAMLDAISDGDERWTALQHEVAVAQGVLMAAVDHMTVIVDVYGAETTLENAE